MPTTRQQRSKLLAHGNQEELEELRDKARRNGTKGQQEDVGNLVEYNPNPTFSPCTVRGLRATMSDEELDAAALIAPTPQARLLIRLIKHRDVGLYPDDELFYQWHSQRNQYWLLDRKTLLDHADWVYDVTYERYTPRGMSQRAYHHQHQQSEKDDKRKAMQSRDAGDQDRDSRYHGRKRSRGSLTDDDKKLENEVVLDRDETDPLTRSFGRSLGKRRKLSKEEQRFDAQSDQGNEEATEDEEETKDLDEPNLLLVEDEVVSDPLRALREQFGDLLEVIYLDTATASEFEKLLQALELPMPEASKKDRRDDLKQALINAEEDDLLPEYLILLPNDPIKAKEGQLPPLDAHERHFQSGVNYENGKTTRTTRKIIKVGEYMYGS